MLMVVELEEDVEIWKSVLGLSTAGRFSVVISLQKRE